MLNFINQSLGSVQGHPQSSTETIDKLCDRITHSSMLEDRRASVLGLKGLSKDFKLQVGTKGMSGLINILKNDRMDVDIINATLETFNILTTSDKKSKHSQDSDNDLGVMFTEIYVKDPKNVTLLLDILEESDFYVRFHTVEFLCTLLANMSNQLQDCILTSPKGLLLLISLTQSNAEIQKIVAFENAFDRLLAIIVNEGATDGGIVVQDCLQLTQNLLRHNASNQNFFRENSCIQRLQYLLAKFVVNPDTSATMEVSLTHESNNWADDQKVNNTVAVLELIRTLVSPDSPSTLVNQSVINQSKILLPIVNLAMSAWIPSPVRSCALLTVGDIIRGNKAGQEAFSAIILSDVSDSLTPAPGTPSNRKQLSGNTAPLKPGHGRPIVFSVIETSLSKEDFSVRSGATYVMQSLFHANKDMQLLLASTFTTPPLDTVSSSLPSTPATQSAGSIVVDALLDWDASSSRKDPYKVWFAAVIMSYIVNENLKTKEMALALSFGDGEDSVNLLHRIMYQLSSSAREAGGPDVRVLTGLLSFLCVWLHEYPAGVKEFFVEGANLQFLTEQIIQSSGVDVQVQGLSAFLLGICYEYNDDSEPTFNRASLQSLIISRMGADVFAGRIERLRGSKYFQKANMYFEVGDLVDKNGLPAVYFDYNFVELFKICGDSITKSAVTSNKTKKPEVVDKCQLDSSIAQISAHEKKIAELEALVSDLMTKLTTQECEFAAVMQSKEERITILEAASSISSQKDADSISAARMQEIEQEQEDLLVCLAEQDLEVKLLKAKLRGYGEVMEESGDELSP